jgi:hypothetical protein
MGLLDVWDYLRAGGDARLRQQGYLRSGGGILERHRRTPAFWAPHLEKNRGALCEIATRLQSHGGTLLVLGAGRLLDIPWEDLFPRFERVVLADADGAIVPYVERLLAGAKLPGPVFEIGDLTGCVVDTAAWAEHTMQAAASASVAAKALAEGFERAGVTQAPWTRAYPDVRLAISSNLLSQLSHFPRRHIQRLFRTRFRQRLDEHERAAESLEGWLDCVRARHVADVASFRNAWAYLATDVDVVVYALNAPPREFLTAPLPPNAGVEPDDKNGAAFAWPVTVESREDPLHGQKVRELWPRGTPLEPPRRWAWHIIPQGSEKEYRDCGRVHVVEAWTKRPEKQ